MIERIAELLQHETAGDPMTGLKWTRKTTENVAAELEQLGIQICPNTVARLLEKMGYSLRVNHKKLSRVCKTSPDLRNAQFEHIAELRESFAARGLPILSIDTKKKELVGLFKNPGAVWSPEPVQVRDHDFLSEADGKAVPYGMYDLVANRGMIVVGNSRDTPEFAVDSIERWWLSAEGASGRYRGATELALLADCGGSNGNTSRAWKYGLFELAERYQLSITVAHYPPGASKWNPVEHRLFSEGFEKLGRPPVAELRNHPELHCDDLNEHRPAR